MRSPSGANDLEKDEGVGGRRDQGVGRSDFRIGTFFCFTLLFSNPPLNSHVWNSDILQHKNFPRRLVYFQSLDPELRHMSSTTATPSS